MDTQSDLTIGRIGERRMLLQLAGICGLLIVVGVSVATVADVGRSAAIVAVGDVSDAQIVEIRDRSGVTVLSGEFRSRIDMLGNTEKDAALADRRGRVVIGEVEIEIPAPTREHRRAELEVDIIGLAALEAFAVIIDDRVVGAFRTDDRGSVDMELQEGEIPNGA